MPFSVGFLLEKLHLIVSRDCSAIIMGSLFVILLYFRISSIVFFYSFKFFLYNTSL